MSIQVTKGAGIIAVRTISKGPRKAEVIVTLEGGTLVTRHLKLLGPNEWRDNYGNVYSG